MWWQLVNFVSGALKQLTLAFEVVAQGEMCFECMGAGEKGVGGGGSR